MSATIQTTQDFNVKPTVTTKQRETRGRPRKPTPTAQQLTNMTKQSRCYYKHRDSYLTTKQDNYYINKQVQTNNNISFIPEIRKLAYIKLKHEDRESFLDAYFHCHGAPKNRIYSKPKRPFYFHMPMELGILIDSEGKAYPTLSRLVKPQLTGKSLSLKICHALGFEWSTSMSWREVNQYTNKLETHTICFDGSGLDMSHRNDLVRIQALACETGLRGKELMAKFADTYSTFCYLRMWKGNKIIYSQF